MMMKCGRDKTIGFHHKMLWFGSIADTGCFTATAELAAIALTVDLAAADCFVDPGFHSIYELMDFIHKALSSSAHAYRAVASERRCNGSLFLMTQNSPRQCTNRMGSIGSV